MKKLASRKDSRIIDLLIEYGPEGYGTYALLVEYLKERKAFRSINDIRRIAYELHANEEILRAVIEDFNLFEIVDGQITFKVIERKAPAIEEVSEPSEPSEFSESSESSESSAHVAPPVAEAQSASSKRRARHKRLREHWCQSS